MPSRIQSNDLENEGRIIMGSSAELKTSSRCQASKSSKSLSPGATRSLKLHFKHNATFKSQNPNDRPLSQQGSEIIHVDDQRSALLKYSRSRPKERITRKEAEAEELVKYMSNLPRYLQLTEKTDNIQGKALNFGVLDWGRLEKWKYGQKQVSGGRNMHSTSSSDSSSFSTFGSSSQSGQSESGTSSIVPRKRTPSSSSHLKSSTEAGHSQILDGKFTIDDMSNHCLKRNPRMDVSGSGDQLGSKVQESVARRFDSKSVTTKSKGKYRSSECLKGNKRTEEVKLGDKEGQLQGSGCHLPDEHCTAIPHAYDFLSVDWSELPQHVEFAVAHWQERSPESHMGFDSTALDHQLTKANRMSFSEDVDFQFSGLSPDVPHSCPFPCNSQTTEWSDSNSSSLFDTPSTQTPSDARHSFASVHAVTTIQCNGNVDQNEFAGKHEKRSVFAPSDGFTSEELKASEEAARDPSLCHPSNMGLNRMNRSVSSKEASVQLLNLAAFPIKPGSSNLLGGSSCGRAKSSPLRRLLDPLLKPRHFRSPSLLPSSHPALEAPKFTHAACKSFDAGSDSLNGPPAKRSMNFSNWLPSDAHVLPQDERRTPSTMHALLQLTHKNGLPLFTFTFNDSDILAATKKKEFISGKDDFEWVYTFYSVHKVRKKSGGWIGSKDKQHGFVSNVVGQMKVSDSQHPYLKNDDSDDPVMVKEFVLFSAEVQKPAHDILDFLPNRELVAIIVEAPKEKSISNNDYSDLSKVGTVKSLPQARSCCHQAEDLQSRAESWMDSSIVVILPNGVHGLPAKGEPSPLIYRWRSGGSCDCGGWDVGCTLTILGDQDRQRRGPSSFQSCCPNDAGQVDLYVQGGVQENGHVFSLAAFKEGLYTVDFNASISLLQAFSISIATIHGRKSENLFETHSTLYEGTLQEPRSNEDDRHKRAVAEAPAAYVPYPPLSPVGRV
ncbi:hypothetical protein ACLOJK_012539 [Asimina triloba]